MLTVDWTTTPPEYIKPCPDCGGAPTVLTDYVLDDGEPVAQVLIALDPHAPFALVTLSLQDEIEEKPFSLRMWRHQGDVAIGFVDDDEVGALTREQALEHPHKDAVFAMLDAVTEADSRVREHLNTKSDVSH